jgi:5-formyltetrahydrofolate cyclo-ligase
MGQIRVVDPGKGFLVVSGVFTWLSPRLPGTVSAFVPLPDEIDVSPLFDRLPGWRWVLPRVETEGGVSFRDRDLPRKLHTYGMEQPIDGGTVVSVLEIDIFLVPGVVFGSEGQRLGRGGGFYEKVLSERRPDSIAVGVTTESRVCQDVPIMAHDQRVDWLATESGVKECLTTI